MERRPSSDSSATNGGDEKQLSKSVHHVTLGTTKGLQLSPMHCQVTASLHAYKPLLNNSIKGEKKGRKKPARGVCRLIVSSWTTYRDRS